MRKYTERQVKAALEKVRAKSLEQGRREARDEEDRLLQKVALVVGTRQAMIPATPQPAPPRYARAFPEDPAHHTEGVRTLHAHLRDNPGDRHAHGVYADELEDAGATKEAALHRYLYSHDTGEQEARMHELVAAHGGDVSAAAHAVSKEAHDQTTAMYPGRRYREHHPYHADEGNEPFDHPHDASLLAERHVSTFRENQTDPPEHWSHPEYGVWGEPNGGNSAHRLTANEHRDAYDLHEAEAEAHPHGYGSDVNRQRELHKAAGRTHLAAASINDYASEWWHVEGNRRWQEKRDRANEAKSVDHYAAWLARRNTPRDAKAFDAAHHLRGAHIPAEHPGVFYPFRPGVREEPNPVPAAEAHRRERVVTAQAMQLAGLPVGGGVTNMPSRNVATGAHHDLFDHFQYMARQSLNEDTEIAARYRNATKGLTHGAFVPHQHLMEAASILHEAVSRHPEGSEAHTRLQDLAGRLGHGTPHEEAAPEIDLAESGYTAPRNRYSMGRARKDPSVIPLSRGGRKKVFAPPQPEPHEPLGLGRIDEMAPFHFKGLDEDGNEVYVRSVPRRPEHRTEAVMGTHAALEEHLQSGGTDVTPRLVHADALDDAGDSEQAALHRVIAGHMPPSHLADQFAGRNRKQSLRAAARRASEGANEATMMASEGTQHASELLWMSDHSMEADRTSLATTSLPQNEAGLPDHKTAHELHTMSAEHSEAVAHEHDRRSRQETHPRSESEYVHEAGSEIERMAASAHRHAAEQHRIAAAYHAAAHSLTQREAKSCGPGEDDPCGGPPEGVKPSAIGPAPRSEPGVDYYPVGSIRCDPAQLQYKDEDGGTSGGMPDGLNAARRIDTGKVFDAASVPPVALWKDPSDGDIYIVDGHKRLGAARRQGAAAIRGRLIEAGSFEEAKAKGVELNEEMGTKARREVRPADPARALELSEAAHAQSERAHEDFRTGQEFGGEGVHHHDALEFARIGDWESAAESHKLAEKIHLKHHLAAGQDSDEAHEHLKSADLHRGAHELITGSPRLEKKLKGRLKQVWPYLRSMGFAGGIQNPSMEATPRERLDGKVGSVSANTFYRDILDSPYQGTLVVHIPSHGAGRVYTQKAYPGGGASSHRLVDDPTPREIHASLMSELLFFGRDTSWVIPPDSPEIKSCHDDALASAVTDDSCPKCGSRWVTAPRLYPDLKSCQDCGHDWDCTELPMSTGQTLTVSENGQTTMKAEPEEYPYGRLGDVSTNGEAVCSG